MTVVSKRTSRLNVRLEEAMMDKLSELGKEMSLAPSTLAAVAIVEYVNIKFFQKRLQQQMVEASAGSVENQLKAVFSDPALLQLLASSGEDQPRLEGI